MESKTVFFFYVFTFVAKLVISEDIVCPEQDGLFLHPRAYKCEAYIDCLNGVATVHQCDKDHQFHIEKGQCVPRTAVTCDLQWVMLETGGSVRTSAYSNLEDTLASINESPTDGTAAEAYLPQWLSERADHRAERLVQPLHAVPDTIRKQLQPLAPRAPKPVKPPKKKPAAKPKPGRKPKPARKPTKPPVKKPARKPVVRPGGGSSPWYSERPGTWGSYTEFNGTETVEPDFDSEDVSDEFALDWEYEYGDDYEDNYDNGDDDNDEVDDGDGDMETFVSSIARSEPYIAAPDTPRSRTHRVAPTLQQRPKYNVDTTVTSHSEVYRFNATTDPEKGDKINGMAVRIVNDKNSKVLTKDDVTQVDAVNNKKEKKSIYSAPFDHRGAQRVDIKMTNRQHDPSSRPTKYLGSILAADEPSLPNAWEALSGRQGAYVQHDEPNQTEVSSASAVDLSGYKCPKQNGVFVAQNTGCEKFLICKENIHDVVTCGDGFKFDQSWRMCRAASKVKCDVNSRSRRQANEFYSQTISETYQPELDITLSNDGFYDYPYSEAFAPAAAAPVKKTKTIKVFQQTDNEGHINLHQGATTSNDSTLETEVRLHDPKGFGSELAHKNVKHEVNEEEVNYDQNRDFWNKDIVPVKKAVPLMPVLVSSVLGRRPGPMRTVSSPAKPRRPAPPAKPRMPAAPPKPAAPAFPGGAQALLRKVMPNFGG